MPAVKQPRAKVPAAPRLPKLSVAKVEQAGLLLEAIVEENTDLFIAKGQAYRDKHREGTGRPLTVFEVGQLAAAMSMTLSETQEQLEDSGLRHYDEPARNELLIAAGVATAPAFIRAAMRFVALIEMTDDQFAAAYTDDTIDDALEVAVAACQFEDVKVMRARASAAMDHFATGVADQSGKGLALIARSVIQGLAQAMSHLEPLEPSSLIDSALSTEGSPDPTSSSSSDTPALSN